MMFCYSVADDDDEDDNDGDDDMCFPRESHLLVRLYTPRIAGWTSAHSTVTAGLLAGFEIFAAFTWCSTNAVCVLNSLLNEDPLAIQPEHQPAFFLVSRERFYWYLPEVLLGSAVPDSLAFAFTTAVAFGWPRILSCV